MPWELLEVAVVYVRRSPGIYQKGLKKVTMNVKNRSSHFLNTGSSAS
jgi:hypothetical protein